VLSRALVLAALVVSAVLAVLLLITSTGVDARDAFGWVFVVLALYLGSLLVP
jgi:hypothetical protein